MIKYTITSFGTKPDGDYFVRFLLENTENGKERYVQSFVPVSGNEARSESEICTLAFSGDYDKITGVSGVLESIATVVGAEFVPPDM
jgi:hypothetical protein